MSKKENKGIGRKLAVYVAKDDFHVLEALEEFIQQHKRQGYRTSLSFELMRVAKIGLLALQNDKIKGLVEKEMSKQVDG